MKKILIFLVVAVYSISSASAKFAIMDIAPECLINGVTITQTWYNASDTSRWYMPKAYDGTCESIAGISSDLENAIFKFVDNFFKKYLMYRDEKDYKVLNSRWQDFINKSLFPKLQDLIWDEIQKLNPDYNKIAMYNYIAAIIWYDFQIRQPGEQY